MTIKKVLSEIKKGDYEYVDMRFTDPRGKLQHVTVMASEVDEGFLKSGWMFDGSSIAGWKSINESDMKLMPDLDSGYLDPFYSEKTYCLHCNVVEPESGKLYGRDPRSTAVKAEDYLKKTKIGTKAFFGPEAEFFLFDDVKFSNSMNKVSFEVDAISNNSLRIHPLQTTVVESEVFFVDIMAEEINALAGAGITLNFYSNDLTLVDVKKGNFFSDDSDNIILFINENESAGITNLQIDIATIDDSQFADGTGVMVVLEFEALSAGTTTIEFDGNYTTLRNANNGEININELVNGFVKIF